MIELIKRFILIVVFVYIGFGLLLFIKQRNFLYFPTPEVAHAYDEEIFSNENESIRVVVLNKEKENAILYFGGNGEAVERNADDFIRLFPSHAVYLVKYRGYGGSTGTPNERAIYFDALYIFDQIKSEYKNISVIGRSLGSGVAILLASKKDVAKMVLITPFDSIERIAQDRYPLYPISLLLKDKYDSLSRVDSITAQTLMIIAEEDKVIDRKYSLRLANRFSSELITVETLKNTGHNSLASNQEYFNALKQFFRN
jgi:pimeloyl-ACP methyl ester carboxylesterase